MEKFLIKFVKLSVIRMVKFLFVGCTFAVITWEWRGNYTHNARDGDDLNQRIVITVIVLVHELHDTWKELLIVTVSSIYENVILTPAGRANGHIISPRKLDLNRARILRKEFFSTEKYQANFWSLIDHLRKDNTYIYRFFKYDQSELKINSIIVLQSFSRILFILSTNSLSCFIPKHEWNRKDYIP